MTKTTDQPPVYDGDVAPEPTAEAPTRVIKTAVDIFSKKRPRTTQRVTVPEWETDIIVRALSAKERAIYIGKARNADGDDAPPDAAADLQIDLLILACVDEEGHQIFNEAHRVNLRREEAATLDKLGRVAVILAGLNREETEKAAEADLKKTRTGNSSSVLDTTSDD